jgi:hypothetical protein
VPAHVTVEQELRVTVDVERTLGVLIALAEALTGPIDRRRRGVDERDAARLGVFEQVDGISVVAVTAPSKATTGRAPRA